MKAFRAILLTVLYLAPTAALADPVTALTLVAYAVGGTYAAFAVAVIGGIYASSQARRKARAEQARLKAEAISNMVDKTQTVYSANPPHQYAYGSATLTGIVVAIFHSDKTGTREDGSTYTRPDGFIHYVIEWTHRQASAIREVFIDGVAVGPTDGSGNATSGEFFSVRKDSRYVEIAASSFVDVPVAVVDILSCYYTDVTNERVDVTPTLSLGNTRITNPAGFLVQVNYTVQSNLSSVRVNHHLGDPSQMVDAYLNSVRPTEWDSSHRGRGRCYSVFTLDQEDQRFQSGAIPLFQADGDWALVLDVRTGVTAWSDNPALCIRDWLQSDAGYRCVDDDIDDAYTIASANACDALVMIDDGAGPYSAKKYTCNGAFTSDMGKEAVLSDLEECMCGHAAYGAQWMIQAGYWTTPVTLPGGGGGLGENDLDGQISVAQSDTPSDELFNSVRGNYYPKTISVGTAAGYVLNGAHSAGATSIALNIGTGTVLIGNGIRIAGDDNTYTVTAGISGPGSVTIQTPGLNKAAGSGAVVTVVSIPKTAQSDMRPPYQNAAYIAADGGEEWADELSLPFTNTGGRARNIARIKTEQNRAGLIINFPAKLRGIVLKVGDRVPVTNAEHGYAQSIFRVTDRRFGLLSAVMLTLQEDSPGIYDEADAATAEPLPNTRLANPYSVQAIVGLAAASSSTTALRSNLGVITPRVSVTWNAVTDRYVIERGRIRIRWRSGSQPWVTQDEPGDALGTYIVGPEHGDRIVIEVSVTNALGKVGPPVQIAHTVSGAASIDTDQLAPGAATDVVYDSHDFAGASSGSSGLYVDQRSINYTPTVDCDIEFTASITASGVLPDAANNVEWTVSAGGGADTLIAYCNSDSGSRQTFPGVASISATGGVALVFKLRARRQTTNPQVFLYFSAMRFTVIKR